MTTYNALLRQHNMRNTAPRRRVFEYLLAADAPLAIADIIAACPTVDRVTIYRSLEVLTEIGAVQVVPMGWKQRYEVTSLFRSHHHHLHCSSCGSVVDIASARIERLVQDIAEQHNFTPLNHTFEIAGRCGRCQTARHFV